MKPFWPRTRQLLPVHLQARDSYIEDLLQLRITACAPVAYGLVDVKVDDAAWTRGSLTFKSISCIFPSGLMFQSRQAIARSGSALPRGSFGLSLALARPVLRGPNVMAPAATEGVMRFRAQGEPAQPVLLPEVRLIVDGEANGEAEVIPLGRVERNGVRLQWERGSVPVMARVRASGVLQSELDRLVASLQQRRGELLRSRGERPFRLLELATQDLPPLQLLALIQRYTPLLVDATRRPGLPPGELYDLLTSIYGSLAAFASADRDPPAYLHDKPGESLLWLLAEIRKIVDEAARDRTAVLPFQRVAPGSYRLTFDRESLVGKRPFLVASGADETFLRDRIPSLLKMASPTAMPSLLQSALRGVAVAPEFEPASVIPRRPDVMTYRIDVRDPLWLDIEDRRSVLLHLPEAPASLGFTLYGIERVA